MAFLDGPLDFITVKTTLPIRPLPAHATREPVLTPKLLIRPLQESDLPALHALRSQQEVMRWTSAARADADMAETETKLRMHLPPNDANSLNTAICLQETGEFVGIGGCHMFSGEFGWPVIGYMLASQHWGKGYASEFVKAFLGMWWALPREEVELSVDRGTARITGKTPEGVALAEEVYTAVTVPDNFGSQKVLERAGFEKVRAWEDVDPADPSGQTMEICLGYAVVRPQSEGSN
ncbi:GNAT domain-containing protein [Plectosphaerella plurivora]|uniref:GNAT domain-containing protein n=1 Tax=Plectosphaerella plurivora TaxID=936078 RepID=A0A9P9AAQ5_9PEZI|nr:GNAT domain-containing protein [Plectosphaerella plurivora]